MLVLSHSWSWAKEKYLAPEGDRVTASSVFQPAGQSLCCVQRLERFIGRERLGELGVDGSAVLKLIRDWLWMCGSLDSSRFATRILFVSYECRHELGVHYLRKGGTSQIFGNNPNKYLSTTLTSQNWLLKEIKTSLKSDNACYHSVQNFLSSCML